MSTFSRTESASTIKSRCKIFCRKRPVNNRERKAMDYDVVSVINNTTVVVHFPKLHYNGVTKSIEHAPFQFHRTFNETTTNQQVYEAIGKPLVDKCLHSTEPSLLFATGQTGSGKTYSLYACLESMAMELFEKKAPDTLLMVESFEVYGEDISDLLLEDDHIKRGTRATNNARHGKDGPHQSTLPTQGLVQKQVTTVRQFLLLMRNALKGRKTSTTKKNNASSRSHWIVNILLKDKTSKTNSIKPGKSKSRAPQSTPTSTSKTPTRTLTVVDLAGSERHHDSNNHTPKLLKESSFINQSLLSLKKVIRAMSDTSIGHNNSNNPKQQRRRRLKQQKQLLHVFRGSKLTMVLRNLFLHPKCSVHILVTVAPTASCAHHSVDTLRNAAQLQGPPSNVDLSVFQHLYETSSTRLPTDGPEGLQKTPPQVQALQNQHAFMQEHVQPPSSHQQPSPPKAPASQSSSTTSLGPSPRQKNKLVHLKRKLHLKLTGLEATIGTAEDDDTGNNSKTSTWRGLSPTTRDAAAASAQNRYSQGLTSMPPRSTTTPGTTPLLRSHGSMIDMMKKSPVLVAVRVRPLNRFEVSRGEQIALRVTSKGTLSLDLPTKASNKKGGANASSQNVSQQRLFSFDSCVHQTATQKETFMCTGHLLLNKVLSGINACLFCYGATGAGKTHTLIGSSQSKEDRGVLLEFTDELFARLKPSLSTVKITVTEIYREKIRDLLDTSRKPKVNGNGHNVRITNVHSEEIQSSLDMERVLWNGLKNRVTGSTDANERSSRSHAVIHMYITQQQQQQHLQSMVKSKMIFVDLAGSERQERTGAVGKRLKEAASINKSLSALGNVILALVQSSHHVPFRSSLLT